MKPIEANSLIVGLVIFALFLAALYIVGWLIWEIGQRNVKRMREYEGYRKEIARDISEKTVTKHNYDVIMYKLEKLGKMKYKDRERTSVLTTSFFRKFMDEAKRRVDEK